MIASIVIAIIVVIVIIILCDCNQFATSFF